jgi:hypothetical protein|nr:MAG TPA: hypothetical protein [Caudoviricetes sp.]
MYARGVTQMKKSHKKNKNQEIIVDKKTVHFREYTVKELLELGERTNKIHLVKDDKTDKEDD